MSLYVLYRGQKDKHTYPNPQGMTARRVKSSHSSASCRKISIVLCIDPSSKKKEEKKKKAPNQFNECNQSSMCTVVPTTKAVGNTTVNNNTFPRTFGLGLVQEENVPVALSPSPFPSMLSRYRRYLCGCGCWLKKQKKKQRKKQKRKTRFEKETKKVTTIQSFNPSILQSSVFLYRVHRNTTVAEHRHSREDQGLLHGGGGGGGGRRIAVVLFLLLFGQNVVAGDFNVGDLIHQLQTFRYLAFRDPNVLLLQGHWSVFRTKHHQPGFRTHS